MEEYLHAKEKAIIYIEEEVTRVFIFTVSWYLLLLLSFLHTGVEDSNWPRTPHTLITWMDTVLKELCLEIQPN